MGDEGKLDYKVPGNKTVKLALFWASDFFGARDQGVIAMTRKMLGEHGMSLACWLSWKSKPLIERWISVQA